jgi:hypothetical protein
MTQYNFPDDIVQQIIDLEKRLSALERGTSLPNASIDKGALTVRDASRNVRVMLGLLADGSYGLAVNDASGNPLSLAQLAFGLAASLADAAVIPTAYDTWQDDTPTQLTTTVTNKRMIVIVSARIIAGNGGQGTPSSAWFGYKTTGAQVLAPDFGRALYANYTGFGQNTVVQASWVDVRTGIANGAYTVTPQMYMNSTGVPQNNASFAYRRCTVLPY